MLPLTNKRSFSRLNNNAFIKGSCSQWACGNFQHYLITKAVFTFHRLFQHVYPKLHRDDN